MRTSSRPRSMSAFEIVESPIPELVGAHAVVWTTTPWTIPVNQAIAYGPDVEYVMLDLTWRRFVTSAAIFTDCLAQAESHGRDLAERNARSGRATLDSRTTRQSSADASKAPTSPAPIARHPMHKLGGFFAKPRPFLPGEFVTTDQGTGLVHMAPDHGVDDFELCKAHGIDPVFAVEGGRQVPRRLGVARRPGQRHQQQVQRARRADLLGPARGRRVARRERGLPAQLPAFVAVEGQGHLPLHPAMVHRDGQAAARPAGEVRASVRWDSEGRRRSAAPAPRGEGATLRQMALQAIADTRFVPEKGRNRLGIDGRERPDWVISRQRAWGVPIALFVERKTGELLVDPEVNARIVAAVRARRRRRVERRQRRRLARPDRDPADYETRHRHPRRLVRQRLHPRVHARKRALARPALARRPLSRRLRPAPRLVPVVAARKLRHPRPRAVRRGADPRLHDGRQGHENVQEPRQHGQPARPDEGAWRRHLAAVGAVGRLHRGPPHRQGDPRRGRRPVSQAAQHVPLSARRARRVQRGRAGRASRRCPSSSATCCTCRRARREAAAGGRGLRLQQLPAR